MLQERHKVPERRRYFITDAHIVEISLLDAAIAHLRTLSDPGLSPMPARFTTRASELAAQCQRLRRDLARFARTLDEGGKQDHI